MTVLVLIGALLFVASGIVSLDSSGQSKLLAEQAIERALITCYAAEGSYPAEFSYLEQHYGLTIDHDKYIVDYQIFASNIKPDVTLLQK